MLRNRYLLALLVILALAAIFGLASASRPGRVAASPPTSAPARATVSSAIRACPAPGSAGATASSLAVAAASAGTGRAEVTPLAPGGAATAPAPAQVVTQAGQMALVNVPTAPALTRESGNASSGSASSGSTVPTVPARGGVMIQATGSMAQGFEAEQANPGGLSTAQCLAPGTDFWFVGPGQRSASSIQLYLMNTDGQPADATVQIITDSGPALGSTDAGITVPAYGQVVQSLGGILSGSHAVALNVTTSVGRVVAAVLETSGGGPGAWLPLSQPPAKSQVLPGLPGTPGSGQLYVAVPGGTDAQLSVTAITSRGSYQPTGGNTISLPGGSAVSVPLSSLAGIPAALRVTSNVPVAVSMMVPGGAAGAPGAFTAATGPVLEQGVIAGNPGTVGGSSAVILSAPGAAATVRVTELTHGASGPPQVVSIAAGHTVVAALTARGSPFAVVVTPLAGSGPVYAGRTVTLGGQAREILPMTSALTWVPLPPVSSSLTAALP